MSRRNWNPRLEIETWATRLNRAVGGFQLPVIRIYEKKERFKRNNVLSPLLLRRRFVLATGYMTAVKGGNGFVCLVERSWAKSTDDPEFWSSKVAAATDEEMKIPGGGFQVSMAEQNLTSRLHISSAR